MVYKLEIRSQKVHKQSIIGQNILRNDKSNE